jgi:hypothetical protein
VKNAAAFRNGLLETFAFSFEIGSLRYQSSGMTGHPTSSARRTTLQVAYVYFETESGGRPLPKIAPRVIVLRGCQGCISPTIIAAATAYRSTCRSG